MPSLKRSSDNLTRSGPLLGIRIEPILNVQEQLRAAGQKIPSANITGMIDTGASGTLIEGEYFQAIGVESYDLVRLHTASTTVPLTRGRYRVRVVFSDAIAFEVDAVDGSLTGQNIESLIGRDILEQIVFTYDGPNNRFKVTLP